MSDVYEIRKISLPVSGFTKLAEETEAEGHMFLHRMGVEWSGGANRFSLSGETMFGAFVDERLVGVGGLNLCPYSDDLEIGRIRHLFVEKEYRNKGIAGALIFQILAVAADNFETVRLRTINPAAIALYEKY